MRRALIERANLERNESMGFRDLLGKELLFFDGATGTMLQALGIPLSPQEEITLLMSMLTI